MTAYQKAGQLALLIAFRDFLGFYKAADLVKLNSSTVPAVKEALIKLAKTNNEAQKKYLFNLTQLKKSYTSALQKRVKTYTQKDEIKIALTSTDIDFFKPVYPNEKVTVKSEMEYFRFNKLKCKVEMFNQSQELISRGKIAGMMQI